MDNEKFNINNEKTEKAAEVKVEESSVEVDETKAALKKTNWVKELRDWVISILIAVIVAFVVREYVFTLVKVQGQSMEPSLHNNDRLYVNRFFYTPHKGDVVIFTPATDPERPYVKRVIATEGDTVYIDFRTGKVYVNDQLLEEEYIYEETREIGNYIADLIQKGQYSKNDPIIIQPGYIFVLGDNRNNSKDSRHLGPVPIDEVMGGAVFRFWPVNNIGTVHQEAEIAD